MNVTELARRLKLNTKDLLALLPELGFDIGKRAIKIDPRSVERIIIAVENHQKRTKLHEQELGIKEIKLNQPAGSEVHPEKSIKIPETIVVNDLAKKMNLPVTRLIAEFFKNGILATLNERVDFATAVIIGEDLGYRVEKISEEEQQQTQAIQAETKLKELIKNKGENLQSRPPVVVVMGHVDHGKTKLLDAIRETNVVDQEAGGITQHIGAYQVTEKGKLITFLDTPGHEAFKAMRFRGGKIADLAIIVIAADDGLKPQTLEVIGIAQKENLPFVIAINKIDKDTADVEKVKKELAAINLIPEDWGGKTICALISAKQKIGIPDLLDMILLLAEMEELTADPTLPAMGTIIESHIDKGEGPVATVLVQSGTLRTGDLAVVGEVAGKIRAMKDYQGRLVTAAAPSMPVKLLGLKSVPAVGDVFEVTTDKRKFKDMIKQSSYKQTQNVIIKTSAPKNDQAAEDQDDEKKTPELNLVLKCDVLGSQEAIMESLEKIDDPDVKLTVIRKGLGNVTEADVLAAAASQGTVIAFHVAVQPVVEQLAQEKKVEILHYQIIYKLLEEMELRLKILLPAEVIRTEMGKIRIQAVFRTEKKEMIVGGKVLEGRVRTGTKAKVTRQGETVAIGDLVELRSGKQLATEVVKDEDCGLNYRGDPVIAPGDVLEVFAEETKRRALIKAKF